MAETGAAGAQAEVDLDAVVAAERSGVERADGAQALAAEVEARTVDGRQLRRCRRGSRARTARRAYATVWPAGSGLAARGSGYVAVPTLLVNVPIDADVARRGVLREPVEPVVGDLGVGVQHDDVAVAMEADRRGSPPRRSPGGRPASTTVARPAVASSRRYRASSGSAFAIVDDDEFMRRAARCAASTLSTQRRERLQVAVHGNDDVDGGHQRRSDHALPHGRERIPQPSPRRFAVGEPRPRLVVRRALLRVRARRPARGAPTSRSSAPAGRERLPRARPASPPAPPRALRCAAPARGRLRARSPAH